MAAPRRLEKLQSVIKREISSILLKGLNDPRIGEVYVTNIKLSKDLKYCTAYVNLGGTEAQQRTTLRGLQSASGTIQGRLGEILKLRYTPQLKILIDKGEQKAREMDAIFDKIKKEREERDI